MTFRAILALPACAVLLAGVTACGGSDPAPSTAAAPGGEGTAATTAAAALPTATAAPACEVSDEVKQAASDSHVTEVSVIGGCHMVLVKTSLTRADVATATDLCNAVAKVAYVGDVSSVSVDGSDGHELAAAVKEIGGCIGEP